MHHTHPKPLDIHLALEGKRESHTLRLPPETSDLIKEYALAWEVSRADVVAWCVRNTLALQSHHDRTTTALHPDTQEISDFRQYDISKIETVVERFALAVERFEGAILQAPAASAPQPEKTKHL